MSYITKERLMRRGTEYHPRMVRNLDELPEPVRHAYEDLPQQDIRRTILVPPQDHYFFTRSWRDKLTFVRRRTPQRNLFFCETRLVVIEETEPMNVLTIPWVDTLALEMTTVLLCSALDLVWSHNGQIEKIQIEFNTVGAWMFEEELEHARETIMIRQTEPLLTDHEDRASFQSLPLKFRNYTRLSLLPEEHLWAVLYEPAMRQTGTPFLPYLAPNRVLLLTDCHLIMLADGLPNWRGISESTYRIEQHYFPRQHVRAPAFDRKETLTWFTLSLGTEATHHDIRLPLSPAKADALQAMITTWLPQPA